MEKFAFLACPLTIPDSHSSVGLTPLPWEASTERQGQTGEMQRLGRSGGPHLQKGRQDWMRTCPEGLAWPLDQGTPLPLISEPGQVQCREGPSACEKHRPIHRISLISVLRVNSSCPFLQRRLHRSRGQLKKQNSTIFSQKKKG